MFSRVGEIHNSSFNYQSTAADKISAARSVGPDNSEAQYKALSDKDSRFDQDMVKYSFEYEADELLEKQDKNLKEDNINRVFGGLFKD